MKKLMSRFTHEDHWNADETSFFPSAPPDRTLYSGPVSGEKQDKFRISVLVACNSTGTEKEDLFLIGHYQKPCVFKNK
jgi:hypothetical protein